MEGNVDSPITPASGSATQGSCGILKIRPDPAFWTLCSQGEFLFSAILSRSVDSLAAAVSEEARAGPDVAEGNRKGRVLQLVVHGVSSVGRAKGKSAEWEVK